MTTDPGTGGEPASRYKWWILTICCLANFVIIAWSAMCMPVLFHEISQKTGFTMAQLFASWGIAFLPIVFLTIPAGLLGDRFGIRWIFGFGMCLAGIFGALRGFSPTYPMFILSILLYGASFPFAWAVLPKAIGLYFPPQQLGLANGILQGAYGAGASLALMLSGTWLSPMLGGFSRVLLLLGIASVLVGILWLATVRNLPKPALEPVASRVSIRAILGNLLSKPTILLLCLIYALFLGGWMGASGSYPMLAQKARNMSGLAANSVVSVACWLYTLGTFLIPGASDRLGYRRPVYSLFILIAGIGMFLTFLLPPPAVWLWAIVWGFAAGTTPLLFAMPFEMEEVGPAYGGTAIGLILTAGSIAGFIFPLIVAKISQSFSPLQAMTIIGVLCGLFAYVSTGLLIWTIRETGPKSSRA